MVVLVPVVVVPNSSPPLAEFSPLVVRAVVAVVAIVPVDAFTIANELKCL